MPYRLFNFKEVCAYLHLAPADAEQLVRRREIPFNDRGGRLVFRKKDVDAWASQRILGFSRKHLSAFHRASAPRPREISRPAPMLGELLKAAYIQPELTSRTKPSLLRDMVALAEDTGLVADPADLLASLEDREALCSTAMPEGLALLHPRHHEPYMFAASFILLARAAHPLPFGAPDGGNTDLFFLICCQDDRCHLHVLSRICLICREPRVLAAVRASPDAAAMLAVLQGAEQAIIARI